MEHPILFDLVCNHHMMETNGLVTGEHIWHSLWLYGIVVDGDSYYVPDDFDTQVSIIPVI